MSKPLGVAFLLGASAFLVAGVVQPGAGRAVRPRKIEFNRDVRPILTDKCFKCHGSDKNALMANLALNDRASATAKLRDGRFAIVPGKPGQSELVRRIRSTDQDVLMPPPDTHKVLSPDDKDTLEEWIRQGAEYKPHWGFVPPQAVQPPAVKDAAWPKNDIDRFILAKLEEEGLRPSPEADKATLLRRVSLDLIGLPPTASELDAFLNDTSPNAYEKVVDRLLASRRYGERMAMDWMDIARYADSNGYQADYERYQWRWRDWVIDSYNENLPYDEFIVDQVAGDLLPNATLSQKIATGFGRNHRINTEGGVIAEEWRVENVIDRVETTSAAFLGLTSGCARCHSHKYDPITQKDFYRLFAYFNNVPESGTGEERPINHPPTMRAPTPVQTQRLKVLDERIRSLDGDLLAVVDRNIEKTATMTVPERTMSDALAHSLIGRWKFTDPPVAVGSKPETGVNLIDPPKVVGKPSFELGRSTGAVVTNQESYLDLGKVGDFDKDDAFTYGGWVWSEDGRGAPFAKMDTANAYRGWDCMFINGVVYVHLINRFPENTLKVITRTPFPNKRWNHLMITYDGSRKPEGLKVYINGKAADQYAEINSLTETIKTNVPLTVGRRTGSELFNGKVDDLQLFSRALTADEVAWIADVDPAKTLLGIPPAKRTFEQKREIARMVLLQTDKDFAKTSGKRDAAAAERDSVDASIPTLMVMQEMPKPRDCFVLVRGQYDKHGEPVTAGVPQFLPPLPKGAPNNRLGLARWIASPDNPLTARVTVNRWWERFFGTGIVATSEDMGTRAEFPSHPELLDWLANEFVRLKWDTKAMLKEIVMSATYRQSSVVTPELLAKDPQNRLLARGPRFRLTAEVIRDQALYAAGMLFNKIGGPSVKPYQPEGIWDETSFYGNLHNYRPDAGLDRYRRSLYTIWKRTAAPPEMLTFDAPSRETCRVRRARTNTPLQALTLLNDETFVEAARALAQNSLKSSANADAAIGRAFRALLGRKPTTKEAQTLASGYSRFLAKYSADPKSAEALIGEGAYPREPKLPVPQVAAMTVVCSTILNLDETVTKE
ncbi:MAG: DUF1553 domain-containing protein [Armatimonadetes bacterium]|nr:DUF1553 domain-containing protein [Armatimonadota bacterium]